MSDNKVLTDGVHRITPGDIVYIGSFIPFGDRFGNHETDASAYHIVKMCQARTLPSWLPFSKEEIEAAYRSAGYNDGFTFNQLVYCNWIVEKDGLYYITDRFVECSNNPGLWSGHPSREVAS